MPTTDTPPILTPASADVGPEIAWLSTRVPGSCLCLLPAPTFPRSSVNGPHDFPGTLTGIYGFGVMFLNNRREDGT